MASSTPPGTPPEEPSLAPKPVPPRVPKLDLSVVEAQKESIPKKIKLDENPWAGDWARNDWRYADSDWWGNDTVIG